MALVRRFTDAIIGNDGKPRCPWVGTRATALTRYHDEVWGIRTDDESAMFEALTLGVFEVGLSWSVVFGKRDAFRRAFHGFDVAEVSTMTGHDVDQLVQDSSIIRNRAKIEATIANAQAMTSASPSLVELVAAYATDRTRAPRTLADVPTTTPQATAFATRLKSQGVPLHRADERLRVHAERRRGQRPRPWVLPRERLQPCQVTNHTIAR